MEASMLTALHTAARGPRCKSGGEHPYQAESHSQSLDSEITFGILLKWKLKNTHRPQYPTSLHLGSLLPSLPLSPSPTVLLSLSPAHPQEHEVHENLKIA